MMVCLPARLAFLAMTKAASTAIEAALRPHCDVVMTGDPGIKHMRVRKFNRTIRPLIEHGDRRIETVAVMRDPVDWLGSWYRYRQRDALAGKANSTADVTFKAFVEGYLSPDPPAFARVGRPVEFVKGQDGEVGIDHLFRYDDLGAAAKFLSARIGAEIAFDRLNVSPCSTLDLPEELAHRLAAYFAPEYEIYSSIATSSRAF
ncbi:MAG: gamma-glutamyl kinase [Pseudomonadota bacterium]